MDIFLSLVGGVVIIFGPFFSLRFFNLAATSFEKLFYCFTGLASFVIGVLLFVSFWPTGLIALAVSFLITYIFLVDRDPVIEVEPEIEQDLTKIINEIEKD
jgi:hypothetical protein